MFEDWGLSRGSQPDVCPSEPPPKIYSRNIPSAVKESELDEIECQGMFDEMSN